MRGVHDLRTPKAAVENQLAGKILRERFPAPDHRGADKLDPTFRRRIREIRLLKGRNFSLPLGKIVVRLRANGWPGQQSQN